MEKYSFLDDYSEGCHPNILNKLAQTNLIQQTAYGLDEYSLKAKEFIKQKLNNKHSEIFFVSGGTQANLTITSALLRTHEAVISADIGHVLLREAGALEATGHKVISVSSSTGKLNVELIKEVLYNHRHAPHMVKPKLVYISNATEIGTIYTKKELEALSTFCKENSLYFWIDGARLAAALTSPLCDYSLEDLAKLVDVFTLGATKNGALLGEAIVINKPQLAEDFNAIIKQKGAMLAKGRVLGIQFYELFKENLYFELAKKANSLAFKLSDAFVKKGYRLLDETQSNQIFLILPNSLVESLRKKFVFSFWEKYDEEHQVIRMVTSWTSLEDKIEELISSI